MDAQHKGQGGGREEGVSMMQYIPSEGIKRSGQSTGNGSLMGCDGKNQIYHSMEEEGHLVNWEGRYGTLPHLYPTQFNSVGFISPTEF